MTKVVFDYIFFVLQVAQIAVSSRVWLTSNAKIVLLEISLPKIRQVVFVKMVFIERR